MDQWNPESQKSRVEYATELISITKELDNRLSDREFMIKISRHFEDEVS